MALNAQQIGRPLDVRDLFKRHFGSTPTHLVRAPGRSELLGNHTDYNQGLVMSLALDRYIHIGSSQRNDGKIELVTSSFPERETFWANDFKKNPDAPWANYVKGVLEQLRKRGVNYNGFNAAITGDIPMGAGMSSSAALEVATALTVRRLYPFSLGESGSTLPPERDARGEFPPIPKEEKLHFAKLCQAAENRIVGVQSG